MLQISHMDFWSLFHILLPFPPTGRDLRRKLVRSFILCYSIIFGERSAASENLRTQTSIISVPDFALQDRVLIIQNGRHKTQNTRDKYRLVFYSYSKWMWGLQVQQYHKLYVFVKFSPLSVQLDSMFFTTQTVSCSLFLARGCKILTRC